MKKIIEFAKQLEESKIINKLQIEIGFQDEIRFDKGLIKFWAYEENPENNEYYIEIYKCEHKEDTLKGGMSGIMLYDKKLYGEVAYSEEEVIKIIKEYVKRTNYNEQRVRFLTERISKLSRDLSNEELNKKYPKISNAKMKKLEQFKNDLIIATTFYK